MTPLNTIGCIALGISALCAVAAFARGEWDIKSRNEAINNLSDQGADWGSEGAFHNPAFTSDTE